MFVWSCPGCSHRVSFCTASRPRKPAPTMKVAEIAWGDHPMVSRSRALQPQRECHRNPQGRFSQVQWSCGTEIAHPRRVVITQDVRGAGLHLVIARRNRAVHASFCSAPAARDDSGLRQQMAGRAPATLSAAGPGGNTPSSVSLTSFDRDGRVAPRNRVGRVTRWSQDSPQPRAPVIAPVAWADREHPRSSNASAWTYRCGAYADWDAERRTARA
jgi:hypothetical protein